MLEQKPHSFKETILSIENLSLNLGDNPILRDITIGIKNVVRPDVIQGQIVAILGRSGIGKTQLFRTVAGLQNPTGGNILVGENRKPIRIGQVGVVTQNYYFSSRLTVINTLIRAGKQAGLNAKSAREKGLELLQKFGIADRKNFYRAKLSGGQKQRVAIIEQLMCSDDLLLMDEPFSGLDERSKQSACQMIIEVANQNEKNTIIVTTHDIEYALKIADTIWLMGRDKDEKGNFIAGSRVIEIVDLISMGLAWQPEIHLIPEFNTLSRELKNKFLDPNSQYA